MSLGDRQGDRTLCSLRIALGQEQFMEYISSLQKLKQQAKRLKIELDVLYLACRDPRVPWYARVLAICVVGYAFSPIDLIPDFIPILGYLDDLIIVPLGIVLVVKMIPLAVMVECRVKAQSVTPSNKPKNWIAAGIFLIVWILFAVFVVRFMLHLFNE
ncbi:MAG: hypothetical protein RLZZ04_1449 [Cyanobacteriota bacterium]|jgi:uncharacterized membrane protein YkvA (DUF1232 family)